MRTLLLIYTLSTLTIHAGPLVYEKTLSANLVAVDAKGNAYVANSGTVTRLNPDGSVNYTKSVALGGTWSGIAVDPLGNLIIAGTIGNDTLPATTGVLQLKRNSAGTCLTPDPDAKPFPCTDAFVAKLDPAGNLLWASYLGGRAAEQATAVAVDASGNIIVVGLTSSFDFPIVTGLQTKFGGDADGFVAKITPDGSTILYSSFIGGSAHDLAHAVAVDSGGNAYIAGESQGSGLATAGSFGRDCANSGVHAFLLKLSPAGALVYGGCTGSAGSTSAATAVAVDAIGNAYVGGVTNAKDFPSTSGAFDGRAGAANADFIAKVSADGASLVYSSLFDGAPLGIYSISVDATGSVIAAGSTVSSTIAVAGTALQPCPGPADSTYNFLLKLNPAGSKLTYFSFENALQPTITIATAADGTTVEAAGLVRKFTSLDASLGTYVSPLCVLNGASLISHFQAGQPGISPGELVTLQGVGLGPGTGVNYDVSAAAPTSLGGTQVLFDGVAAPILYAQDRQVNVIAPYSLSTKKETSIQVKYQGVATQAIVVPVSATSVAALRNPQTGRPLLLNQDLSPNSPDNPAAPGSAINLFVTGGGLTSPASVEGQMSQTPGTLQVVTMAVLQNYSANPVSQAISLIYAGSAPGRISAIQLIKVQIPADLPSYFLTGSAAANNRLLISVGGQGLSIPISIR